MTKRVLGQIGKLKKDKVEEYVRLHASVWPEVIDKIRDCNIRNYSIFLEGDVVFSYFEYTGSDYEKDMEKMALDEATQKWWSHTHPCFETYALGDKNEYVKDMRRIFHMER